MRRNSYTRRDFAILGFLAGLAVGAGGFYLLVGLFGGAW